MKKLNLKSQMVVKAEHLGFLEVLAFTNKVV